MEGEQAVCAKEPSKMEHQIQYLAQNLDFLSENVSRLGDYNARLNGARVAKTPDDEKVVQEPDGIIDMLQTLNEKFESINSKMSREINELNETI